MNMNSRLQFGVAPMDSYKYGVTDDFGNQIEVNEQTNFSYYSEYIPSTYEGNYIFYFAA